jgi:sugar lactone lactonase YvrE
VSRGGALAAAGGPARGDDAGTPAGAKTLFWLDIAGNSVWRAATDGTDKAMMISGHSISAPDGVAVDLDAEGGHVYWTNMGNPLGGGHRGSLQRARLDGSDVETLVPVGSIDTPKQMTIDHAHQKLYFCDREGAKVWRADLDGKNLGARKMYWTDRVEGAVHRAGMDLPAGEAPGARSDVETLVDGVPDAIGVALDLEQGALYFGQLDGRSGARTSTAAAGRRSRARPRLSA